jgi:hypothetical protein
MVEQGVIPGGHGGVHPCLQIPQPTQRTDDPPTDFLDHGGDVGVGRRLTLDKAGLAARLSAIAVDALKKDTMKMEIEIEGTAKTLQKRDRPWLDLVAWDTACDRLVDVILTDGGADDRMDLRGQLWGRGHPIP